VTAPADAATALCAVIPLFSRLDPRADPLQHLTPSEIEVVMNWSAETYFARILDEECALRGLPLESGRTAAMRARPPRPRHLRVVT